MSLAATIDLPVDVNSENGQVAPISIHCDWTTVMAAGGINTADNSGSAVTSTTAPSTNTANRWFRHSYGTYLMGRMKYAGTPSTDPVVVLWGRKGDNGAPQRLYNRAATPTNSVTLTTSTGTDITDGTSKWTEVNPQNHIWDKAGCDQFLFTVTTAYAVSAGSAATATVEAKGF